MAKQLHQRTVKLQEILRNMQRAQTDHIAQIAVICGVESQTVRVWLCEGTKKDIRLIPEDKLQLLEMSLRPQLVELPDTTWRVVDDRGRVIDNFLTLDAAMIAHPNHGDIHRLPNASETDHVE